MSRQSIGVFRQWKYSVWYKGAYMTLCIANKAKPKNYQYIASFTREGTREILFAWETACWVMQMYTLAFLGPCQSALFHACSPACGHIWKCTCSDGEGTGQEEGTGRLLGPTHTAAGLLTLPLWHHVLPHWTLNTPDSACFGSLWVVTSTHKILAKIQSLIPIFQLDHNCCITNYHKFLTINLSHSSHGSEVWV